MEKAREFSTGHIVGEGTADNTNTGTATINFIKNPGVDLGTGILWANTVYGATEDNPAGTYITVEEAQNVDGYRLPTEAEADALLKECTWEKTTVNGVNGYNVSGNGETIFMPVVSGDPAALEGVLHIAIGTTNGSSIVAITDLCGTLETAAYWSGIKTKFPVYLVAE